MKAILRTSAGLFGLLLLASAAPGYYWTSAVLKQPFPIAPSPSNSGFYFVDAWGRLTGPHYYLVPPCQPFNGILPGATGQAIQQGYLPHTLLMSKEGLNIGNVPMLSRKGSPASPNPSMGGPVAPVSPMYPMANMQIPYPMYPVYGQPPHVQPMPYAPPAPRPMPTAYGPSYGPPVYATGWQDPRTGIWQVNNMLPNHGQQPFMPIPGYHPAPGAPSYTSQAVPMQPMERMQPMQPMMSPPPAPARPSAYPVHPFTRSPRDFFMWGEAMDEERARGNRPVPVP